MNLQKLLSLRDGHRRIISMQFEKIDEDTPEKSAALLIDVILQKAEIIKGLNEKIINHPDTEDISTELVQSEEYCIDLNLRVSQLQDSLRVNSTKITETSETVAETRGPAAEKNATILDTSGTTSATSASGTATDRSGTSADTSRQRTEQTNNATDSSSDSGFNTSNVSILRPSSSFHKLPKLRLPEFEGDITQWQTFWDCFDSSVHSNPSLSDVEKFSYLRSLVHGVAASCIAGFPLTHANYTKAIELLGQRFGQSHKIADAYMQHLIELPRPANDPISLQDFHDRLETNIRGLESLGKSQDSYGDLLVPILREKLPIEIRRTIARDHGNHQWTLPDLRTAIQREIRVLQEGQTQTITGPHQPTASFHTGSRNSSLQKQLGTGSRIQTKKQGQRGNESRTNKKKLCPFCGDEHFPNGCTSIQTLEKRLECVRRKKLCFNCLAVGHTSSTCMSRFRCRHCKRKHHTSICDQNKTSTLDPNARPFSSNSTNNVQHDTAMLHSTMQTRPNVLLKTAIAEVSSTEYTTDAHILFDEGAQRSFISKRLAEDLHLQPTGTETISIASFGADGSDVRRVENTTVHLKTDRGEKIPIDVLIVPTIAVPLPNIQREVSGLNHLRGLKLAHPVTDDEKFEISLLIGADFYWRIVQNRVVRGNGPTAVQSRIGYLLSGPLPGNTQSPSNKHMLHVVTSSPSNLDLERFWKLETIGVTPEDDDTKGSDSLKTYMDTYISYDGMRYTAKLPWKDDHPPLPTNYEVSMRRTESLIRRLRKEPFVLQKYGEIIEEQKERGFIEQVDESTVTDHPVHYIPHHGVKKDSATTPIRIVYDCSCHQTTDEPSLNDCLQSTPPELNDIAGILIRFRLHRYAITSDIEKAFLHVTLDEKDRDVTRFLWLSDPSNPDSPLTTYRFKAILFGATCSPFILYATILKHLENNKDNWVSSQLRRDLYVDNIISSFSQESAVSDFYRDTRAMMSGANFNLRSWNSNNSTVRELAEADKVLDTDETSKILGMRWDAVNDTISFPERPIPTNGAVTKREVLKHTSRLYDPLGLLTPVTIRPKIMLQELWQRKFSWDTPLPSELQDKWHEIAGDLNSVSSVSHNRCLFNNRTADDVDATDDTVLHVFADASMASYGAAVYMCRMNQSALVMSKSRVAPLKKLTLPRLELMAAVIGARLVTHVQQSLDLPSCRVELWSDSQIVLHWLQTPRTLQRFVKNRVSEINQLTDNRKWKYCPTSDNPADLLTRGLTAKQLNNNALWFNGPRWILHSEKWPTWEHDSTTICTTLMNDCGEHVQELTIPASPVELRSGISNVVDVSNYGTLGKLLRVTACVLRFVRNCRATREDRRFEPVTVSELHHAEKLWIKDCQQHTFCEEIENLKSNESRRTLVKQLKLFIDDTGYVRCGGRIHNAPVTEDAKFPYLLPQKHPFTRLIVRDAHERLLHSGTNSTITFLRQKYWIPAIRRCVQTELRRCVVCKKVNGRPYTAPDPPPLPKARVEDSDPFSVTGVDFSGALCVRERNGQERKAYICLFTCAATRAVHLEVVPDLTTETFIQAFRRFCSRKSLPRLLISDNATTFTSAANNLRELVLSRTVQEELQSRGTEWRFIVKRAPWYGGWWERLIGLTKTAVKKVLGRSFVDFQTLTTVVTEIEAIINDRPLTYVTSGEIDDEPLTPSHLLYGRRVTRLPYSENVEMPTTVGSSRVEVIKQAKIKKKLIDDFRVRWKHEYLTALREQHRTSGNNQQTIHEGDVVLVHDERSRATWKLAVIEELLPGNDGRVRAARIRTQLGETTRPITKLYPMEVTDNGHLLSGPLPCDHVSSVSTGSVNVVFAGLESAVSTGLVTAESAGPESAGLVRVESAGLESAVSVGPVSVESAGSVTAVSAGSVTAVSAGSVTAASAGSVTAASAGSVIAVSAGSVTTVYADSVHADSVGLVSADSANLVHLGETFRPIE